MELEPMDDRHTEAKMWVEVDLKNVMRVIPGRVLGGRIRRVMDIEMAAIKAALESATPRGSDFSVGVGAVAHPAKRERAVKRDPEPATQTRSRSTL
jgi:hypothetical protein